MSTRGWKERRRRRTFPVTRRLSTNRIPESTVKIRFSGNSTPYWKPFWNMKETMCRETAPWHVFVKSLAEIDPRKEVVRRSRHKKQRLCDPFFRALSETHLARFRWKRAGLSLFRPQLHLPSFIQIHRSFPDLLATTTFQIVTIIGDPIGYRIADNEKRNLNGV